MTEKELRQKIDASERQIVTAYRDLSSAARTVVSRGCEAANVARNTAIDQATEEKKRRTRTPILISLLGFLGGFLGVITLIIGWLVASKREEEGAAVLNRVKSEHDAIVSAADRQRRSLEEVLDKYKTI